MDTNMNKELQQLFDDFDHAAQDWGWEKLQNDPMMKKASEIQYLEAKDALEKGLKAALCCN